MTKFHFTTLFVIKSLPNLKLLKLFSFISKFSEMNLLLIIMLSLAFPLHQHGILKYSTGEKQCTAQYQPFYFFDYLLFPLRLLVKQVQYNWTQTLGSLLLNLLSSFLFLTNMSSILRITYWEYCCVKKSIIYLFSHHFQYVEEFIWAGFSKFCEFNW